MYLNELRLNTYLTNISYIIIIFFYYITSDVLGTKMEEKERVRACMREV